MDEIGVVNNRAYPWIGDPSHATNNTSKTIIDYKGWQNFMKAMYDYAKNNNLNGCHQYSVGSAWGCIT